MISMATIGARRMQLGARHRLALGLAVLCAVIFPDAVRAQTSFRVVPSFNVAQVYDSNVFSASSDPQADFITRLTPAIKSEYRSMPLTLTGRYTLDGEHFANHSELTSVNARHQAALTLEYHPTQRLMLAADADLWKTQTPGELNAITGLTFTRARAERLAAHSSITREFDLVTSGTIDYQFSEERLAGGFAIRTHGAMVGTIHHVSLRDTMSVDYRFQEFIFGANGPGVPSTATSHAVGVGWTRSMTRRLSLSIAGGPRVTNTSATPELSASVRYQLQRSHLSLAYARTETTVIGLAGTVASQSVTGTASWKPRKSLEMRVSPAFYRSALAGLQADVYRLSAGVVWPIVNGLSLDLAFDTNIQQGNLYAILAHETISRHNVMIRLVADPTTRLR